jgi:cytochrome c6
MSMQEQRLMGLRIGGLAIAHIPVKRRFVQPLRSLARLMKTIVARCFTVGSAKVFITVSVFGSLALWPASVNATDIFNGQLVYETHCLGCHGVDGMPLVPGTPDFTLGQTLDKPDRPLFEAISFGINLMPGYDGIINNQEILDVIAYIRTLRR